MTYDKSQFEDLENLKKPIVITLPNASFVTVLQHGTVRLNSNLTLSCVLYIPSFVCNLISICQLTRDLYCHVICSSDVFFPGQTQEEEDWYG